MITFKNKPTTLFIAGPILGVGMLMMIGYILYNVSLLPAVAGDMSIGAVILVPAILMYLAQIIMYLLAAAVLLWGIYKWSTVAIAISAIAAPLALLIIIAILSKQSLDASNPIDIAFLLFFVLTPLIMGTVAYNDIRYRRKQLQSS